MTNAEINLLIMPLIQLRLVVKRIHLADAAVHEQLHDAADLRLVMEAAVELRLRLERTGEQVATEQMSQRERAEAAAGVVEE